MIAEPVPREEVGRLVRETPQRKRQAQAVVLGRTNVGKTVFTVNFAFYLGVKELAVSFSPPDGQRTLRFFGGRSALEELAGPEPHKTRRLQSTAVQVSAGKGIKRFSLVDTTGIADFVHPEAEVRRGMAQTLGLLNQARLILHMLDAAAVGEQGPVDGLGEIDYQVAHFGRVRGRGYAILANKMDLEAAGKGLEIIRSEFGGLTVLPISALRREGFAEVKRFVARAI